MRTRKGAPTTPSGRGLGRVPHWDPRNERFLIRDVLPRLAARRSAIDAIPAQRVQRYWSPRWTGDQGATSHCTAFSLLTFMADGPVTHRAHAPMMDPDALFTAIRAVDLEEGRDYGTDGGATMLAQQKAATRLGWVGEYRWGTTIEDLIDTVLNVSPVILGIEWLDGMFSPDHKGRIRATGAVAGGHAIECNGVNTKTEMIRLHNSWGTSWGNAGSCFIAFDDMRKLLADDAEIVLARELKL